MASHQTDLQFGAGTVFEFVDIAAVEHPVLREGIAYWQSLCGDHAMPQRADLNPRAIPRLLSRLVLIRVLEDGADFEYVIVGDEVGRAYRAPLAHRRISDIEREMPNTIGFWATVYRQMYRSGLPVAVHMVAGYDGEANFSDGEVVLLPLGPASGPIDHIVTFGRRTLRRV